MIKSQHVKRNTPITEVQPFDYMRPIAVEYDSTSVIPSIAVMSMKGIVDPRLKHNNGLNIDLNVSNDPVALASIAHGVKRSIDAIKETVSSAPKEPTTPQPSASVSNESE